MEILEWALRITELVFYAAVIVILLVNKRR